MRDIRHYSRYTVAGDGTINNPGMQKVKFSINNMSASGINMITAADLSDYAAISMHIRLSGNISIFEKAVKGRIIRRQQRGENYEYGIQFTGLTHRETVELDEYLRMNFGSAELHGVHHHSVYEDDHLKSVKREQE